jgi:hypothetical protein
MRWGLCWMRHMPERTALTEWSRSAKTTLAVVERRSSDGTALTCGSGCGASPSVPASHARVSSPACSLGRRRWVIERTISWLSGYRRLSPAMSTIPVTTWPFSDSPQPSVATKGPQFAIWDTIYMNTGVRYV